MDKQRLIVPGPAALMAVRHDIIIINSDYCLAVIGDDGSTVTIDRVAAALLDALRLPCERDDLTNRLLEMGWEGEALVNLEAELDGLIGARLVRRLDSLLGFSPIEDSAVRAGGDAGKGSAISVLAIPTKNRPEQLRRALEAWAAALHAEGRSPDLVVADDSDMDLEGDKVLVRDFAAGYQGRVFLLDASFREELAATFTAALGRPFSDPLRFALGQDGSGLSGISHLGINRNTLLLACAGRTLVMTDDDALPEFRLRPDSARGLAPDSRIDPTSIIPFPDEGSLASFGSIPDSSILEPHESLVGRPCRQLLRAASPLDCGNAEAAILQASLADDARVAALCFGSWGDSGTANDRYLLFAAGATDRETSDRIRHPALSRKRLVFRAPRRTSLGGGFMMAMHLALDASRRLPPFSPLGRNSDGLWGLTLPLLAPGSFLAHAKEAIHHVPPPGRDSTPEAASSFRPRLNDSLMLFFLDRSASMRPTSDPYKWYGSLLVDISRSPRHLFRKAFSAPLARSIAGQHAILGSLLESYGDEAQEWAAQVEAARDDLLAALGNDAAWLPEECGGDEGFFRSYVGAFGGLLLAWPAIFDEAAKIAPAALEASHVRS